MKSATILTVYGVLAGGVDAFWRMPCKGRTGLARIDPLVNFGRSIPSVLDLSRRDSSRQYDTQTNRDFRPGCRSCTRHPWVQWYVPSLFTLTLCHADLRIFELSLQLDLPRMKYATRRSRDGC